MQVKKRRTPHFMQRFQQRVNNKASYDKIDEIIKDILCEITVQRIEREDKGDETVSKEHFKVKLYNRFYTVVYADEKLLTIYPYVIGSLYRKGKDHGPRKNFERNP